MGAFFLIIAFVLCWCCLWWQTIQSGGFGFDDVTASAIYGIFAGAMYLMAVPGGWLADNWLGQERALWWGSLIIALGHLCIALSAMVGASVFFFGVDVHCHRFRVV